MKLRFRGGRRRDYITAMNMNTNTNMNNTQGCSSGDSYGDELMDRGNEPVILNLGRVSRRNDKRLRVLWTGENMQITVMAIPVGDEVGPEVHESNDQLVIVEDGVCEVSMGNAKDRLTVRAVIDAGSAVIIPAGTYHNLKNVGRGVLRLVSVYAPKEHPYGTVR